MSKEKCFFLVDKFILKTYSDERPTCSYSSMLYLTWMMQNHLSLREVLQGIDEMSKKVKSLKDSYYLFYTKHMFQEVLNTYYHHAEATFESERELHFYQNFNARFKELNNPMIDLHYGI